MKSHFEILVTKRFLFGPRYISGGELVVNLALGDEEKYQQSFWNYFLFLS
jgi:hypothetical protein